MKPHEKRDLARRLTWRLLFPDGGELSPDQTLFGLLNEAEGKKETDVVVGMLMWIRGSKIGHQIISRADTIKAEDGFDETFRDVARRIDEIPDP